MDLHHYMYVVQDLLTQMMVLVWRSFWWKRCFAEREQSFDVDGKPYS